MHHKLVHWNVGIALSERKQPTTIPMPVYPTERDVAYQLRGRNHNPKWALLIEPIYTNTATEWYKSRNVASYEIEIGPWINEWGITWTPQRGIYEYMDEVVAVLHVATLDCRINMVALDSWIKRHPAASNGDNPSGLREWSSAAWVIRVLHYMEHTWRFELLGHLPTHLLHEAVLHKWRERLRDIYHHGADKSVAFAMLHV